MQKITSSKQQGFTLVELLIVIVVIAILAAISIVAYNGFQNRSKAAAAQSLASQVATKAEGWNTVESTYPSLAEFTGNDGDNTAGNPDVAKLDDPTKVGGAAPTDESTVQYQVCNDTANNVGFVIVYYDAVVGTTNDTIRGGQTSGTTVNGTVSCA